jgi:rhamnosyltransferase
MVTLARAAILSARVLRVSLIVRAFNEEKHIGRLLTGIARQTRVPDEVLVVDSGSTDATVSLAAAFGARIEHIAPSDFSFGRALNFGIAASAGDVLVIASAHVYPIYDTWLDRLILPIETDPEVALSYGRQVVPASGRFSEGRLLARWFPSESDPRQRHPFSNNANAAIRRSIWTNLRYDEDLTGLEDLDWSKRAAQAGHLLAYVAEAPVIHVHNESLPQIANRYRREAIAHKQIYEEQRLSLADAVRLGLANICNDLRDAGRRGLLQKHAADIARFRAAQFYGSYRGFAQQGPVPTLLRHRFYYPDGSYTASYGGSAPAAGDAPIGNPIDYECSAPPATLSRK